MACEYTFMKMKSGVWGVLSVWGCFVYASASAAVKLDVEHAVVLGGASLPPGRGSASTGPDGESGAAARLFDGAGHTLWQTELEDGASSWIEYRFDDDVCWLLTEYTLTNGYGGTPRDPQEWELSGSVDGETWVTIDAKARQYFAGRQWAKSLRVRPAEAFNRYRLKVVSNPGGGQLDLAEVGLTVKAAILPPTTVHAEVERGGVSVKWNEVDGATGYTVRRAVNREGPYTLVAAGVGALSYADKGPFEESELCYYVVSAEKDGRRGPLSTPLAVVTPVAAPTELRVKSGGGVAVLEWKPSPRAVAYVVRRSLVKDGPYTTIATMITSPGYTDQGLSAGTAYHYVVCGVANGKEGIDSKPESALFPPVAPTGLVSEAIKEGITLKWNAVALAAGYKIFRAETAEGPKEEVAKVTDETTYLDKAVVYPKTYFYTVSAVNDCGTGEASAAVSAAPLRPPSWWRR